MSQVQGQENQCLNRPEDVHANQIKDRENENKCKEAFNNPGSLKRHRKIHVSQIEDKDNRVPRTNIKCNECKEEFDSPRSLTKHELVHVRDKSHKITINGQSSGQTIDGTKHGRQSCFNCFSCSILFNDKVSMMKHATNSHKEDNNMDGNQGQYDCSDCGFVFVDGVLLTRHIKEIREGGSQ